MQKDKESYLAGISAQVINDLCRDCHASARAAGWWMDPTTGTDMTGNIYFQVTKLGLIHAEVSEGVEGLRRQAMDDKLPEFPMEAVELVDVLIRTFDYAGAKGYDLGTILKKKMEFNKVRADHKIENRINKPGGKLF